MGIGTERHFQASHPELGVSSYSHARVCFHVRGRDGGTITHTPDNDLLTAPRASRWTPLPPVTRCPRLGASAGTRPDHWAPGSASSMRATHGLLPGGDARTRFQVRKQDTQADGCAATLRQGGVALAPEQTLALGLHSSETVNTHAVVGPQSLPPGHLLLPAAHMCARTARSAQRQLSTRC